MTFAAFAAGIARVGGGFRFGFGWGLGFGVWGLGLVFRV